MKGLRSQRDFLHQGNEANKDSKTRSSVVLGERDHLAAAASDLPGGEAGNERVESYIPGNDGKKQHQGILP